MSYLVVNLLVALGLVYYGVSEYVFLQAPVAVLGLPGILIQTFLPSKYSTFLRSSVVLSLVLGVPAGVYLAITITQPFVLPAFLGHLLLAQFVTISVSFPISYVICAICFLGARPFTWAFHCVSHVLEHSGQFLERRYQENKSAADERARDRCETERKQAARELRNLKDALAIEQERATSERVRREQAEGEHDSMKTQCQKLILATESSLRNTETEILELQHCGDPSAEEDVAKLTYRKNGFLREIAELRKTLTNLEQQ